MNGKRIAGALLGLAIGVLVAHCPLQGLQPQGCAVLGILSWAIVWWVFSVLPEYVTALLMSAAMVLVAGVDGATVPAR